MHLGRAGVEQHLDDLPGRRAAHDRVVHDHDALAVDDVVDRVELQLHAVLAQPLLGLDERAPDVAVLDQAVGERQPARPRVALRGRRAGVGHGDDDVGLGRRLGRQPLAHPDARGVEADAVHPRVGPREVDELEDAERRAAALAHRLRLRDARPVMVEDRHLAGLDVAHVAGADDVERARLRRHHGSAVEIAHHERADAVGVAERDHLVAVGDDRRERAVDSAHRVADGLLERAGVLADQGRDHLGVGRGLEPDAALRELGAQLGGIRQVAVVTERDGAARAVAHHRLRVRPARRPGGRVARVADRVHATRQRGQAHLVEHLRNKAELLLGGDPAAVADRDAG